MRAWAAEVLPFAAARAAAATVPYEEDLAAWAAADVVAYDLTTEVPRGFVVATTAHVARVLKGPGARLPASAAVAAAAKVIALADTCVDAALGSMLWEAEGPTDAGTARALSPLLAPAAVAAAVAAADDLRLSLVAYAAHRESARGAASLRVERRAEAPAETPAELAMARAHAMVRAHAMAWREHVVASVASLRARCDAASLMTFVDTESNVPREAVPTTAGPDGTSGASAGLRRACRGVAAALLAGARALAPDDAPPPSPTAAAAVEGSLPPGALGDAGASFADAHEFAAELLGGTLAACAHLVVAAVVAGVTVVRSNDAPLLTVAQLGVAATQVMPDLPDAAGWVALGAPAVQEVHDAIHAAMGAGSDPAAGPWHAWAATRASLPVVGGLARWHAGGEEADEEADEEAEGGGGLGLAVSEGAPRVLTRDGVAVREDAAAALAAVATAFAVERLATVARGKREEDAAVWPTMLSALLGPSNGEGCDWHAGVGFAGELLVAAAAAVAGTSAAGPSAAPPATSSVVGGLLGATLGGPMSIGAPYPVAAATARGGGGEGKEGEEGEEDAVAPALPALSPVWALLLSSTTLYAAHAASCDAYASAVAPLELPADVATVEELQTAVATTSHGKTRVAVLDAYMTGGAGAALKAAREALAEPHWAGGAVPGVAARVVALPTRGWRALRAAVLAEPDEFVPRDAAEVVLVRALGDAAARHACGVLGTNLGGGDDGGAALAGMLRDDAAAAAALREVVELVGVGGGGEGVLRALAAGTANADAVARLAAELDPASLRLAVQRAGMKEPAARDAGDAWPGERGEGVATPPRRLLRLLYGAALTRWPSAVHHTQL